MSLLYGNVAIASGKRIAVLKQNHFEFDEFKVLETVIMGHKRLYDIMQEKDAIYLKPDFNDEDGIRARNWNVNLLNLTDGKQNHRQEPF